METKYKILAIAINDYADGQIKNLNNCVSDVSAVLEVINERYKADDIILVDTPSQATRKELYREISTFFSNALQDENLLLLYAGHGELNSLAHIGYWLPSDAAKDDPASWLGLTEIQGFIKTSRAKHIAIIADSCFSGALFSEPSRGNGMTGYQNRMSREALTSGDLTHVSDGGKGKTSPFANCVIDVLQSNNETELPFAMFAHQVLMRFSSINDQVPKFGTLQGTGDAGGSYLFQQRVRGNDMIKMKSELAQRLGNLHIIVHDQIEDLTVKIHGVKEEKFKQVRAQRYEEASKLRDEELSLFKLIEDKIYIALHEYFKKQAEQTTNKKPKTDKELDSDILVFRELERKKSEERKKIMHRSKVERSFFDSMDLISGKHPLEYFVAERMDRLFDAYHRSFSDLLNELILIKGHKKSAEVDRYVNLFLKNMAEAISLFVKISLSESIKRLEFEIKLKEIDVNILHLIGWKFEEILLSQDDLVK